MVNAAPLAYIIPALCVMKLQNERMISVNNIPYLATAAFGATVSVVGLIMVVVQVVQGLHCSHGQELPYCANKHKTMASLTNGRVFFNGSF